MRMKIFRMILFAVGFVFCLPVLAVILGSLKSSRELMTTLSAVIGGSGEKIHWHLLPLYPTLKHFIKLLFYTPEFLSVFWNSMKIVVCILWRFRRHGDLQSFRFVVKMHCFLFMLF